MTKPTMYTHITELLWLEHSQPSRDVAELSSRIVDFITDAAMVQSVNAALSAASVNLLVEFERAFDRMLRSALSGLDRMNPAGARELRRGILAIEEERRIHDIDRVADHPRSLHMEESLS